MLQQALDFEEESKALHNLLQDLDEADFEQETLFKSWTINDVIGHLHMFNVAAELSLKDEPAFLKFSEGLMEALNEPGGMLGFTNAWLDGLKGRALFAAWIENSVSMARAFEPIDPKRRLKWIGPDMSALSYVTARLMETWAHGQAIYDLCGVERENHDRIRNIAVMGVNTFGWTFRNRELPVPEPAPYVRLIAPSGAIWEWNDPAAGSRVEGEAVAFCQVVTQVRNVADTELVATGDTAEQWMALAQCFAGPPNDPPAPGTRYRQESFRSAEAPPG